MMKLTNVDRERITDSMLRIQSARATLDAVDNAKLPNADEIEECLETANQSLRRVLGYAGREADAKSPRHDDEAEETPLR